MPNTTNDPMTSREFVMPLENRPGTLAEIATALGKANVNIVGFLLEAQGDYGIVRVVTNDAGKTESWLKSSGRPYRANDVITINVQDKPGELGRIASTLAKSGVNVTAAYPTSGPKGIGITFAVDDVGSAKKALQG